MSAQTPRPAAILLFDGDCVLCHAAVRFLLHRDRTARLRFAPLESPLAQALLTQPPPRNTLLFLPQPSGTLLIRSNAVLAALALLPPPWPRVARLLRVIPRPVRDLAYRIVARLRRLLSGPVACPIPTPFERTRILHDLPAGGNPTLLS